MRNPGVAVALAAIRGYQRFISPHKGFCCAYRAHTGRASCSTLGLRAVRRYGVVHGIAVLRERTWRCGVAQRRHGPARPFRSQRGDCDCACDLPSCDLPTCETPGFGQIGRCAGEALNCGSCDWPSRRSPEKRQQEREQRVHLPPQRGQLRPEL